MLWRRHWHTTPVLLPGKSHGWRSLVGCSPWGLKGSDTTERLHFHFSFSCIGGGNGNPLQCPCLENPMDRGAWWATVHGVSRVGHDRATQPPPAEHQVSRQRCLPFTKAPSSPVEASDFCLFFKIEEGNLKFKSEALQKSATILQRNLQPTDTSQTSSFILRAAESTALISCHFL